MDFVAPSIAVGLLILKLVDFVRYAKARDLNGVVTQLVVWGAGIGVLALTAQTAWAGAMMVNGVALSKLGGWSLVFAGLTISSGASLAKDVLKAVDNHNSAAIPTLLPSGPAAAQPEGVG